MKVVKSVLVAGIMGALVLALSACSTQDVKQKATDAVNEQVDKATQEVTNQVEDSMKEAVNKKIDSIGKSIESTLDPKLGAIRKNMENVKQAALVYYNINKKMPPQNKLEPFFDKTFEAMKLQYTISNDQTRAFISYIGKDYKKEKLPDVTIDPNAKE